MKAKRWLGIMMAIVLLYALSTPAFAVGPNLIVNGNFEAGNSSFDSAYTYVAVEGHNTLGDAYVYAIGTKPYLYHSSWSSFGDHTSGTGNMMIVNGTTDGTLPNKLVWGQAVTGLTGSPTYPETTKILYAGKDWAIGEVRIKTSADGICIKFVITDQAAIAEGWRITEGHAAVAATCAGIPQVKGNPVPGQFPGVYTNTAGVTETDWICLAYSWSVGQALCIAAHAKIVLPELSEIGHIQSYDFCMLSGADTDVITPDGIIDATVPAIQPWGNLGANVSTGFVNCTDVASYIWDANVSTSYYADNGGLVDFVQNFNIIGTPTAATLKIAADNSFAYSFNDGIEDSENLTAGWRDLALLGDFGYPYMVIDPNSSGWGAVYTYDVLSKLVSGNNVFNVTGVNADWATTDWNTNPAAVVYKLCGTSEQYIIDRPYRAYDSESGWGEGTPFPGKNWATCMRYTPQVGTDYGSYRLELYVASSYPASPAQLEVQINGIVVPPTLEATSTTGEWVKYSAIWNAGTASSALIQIRDLRVEYNGDDFCIDDISFVKVS